MGCAIIPAAFLVGIFEIVSRGRTSRRDGGRSSGDGRSSDGGRSRDGRREDGRRGDGRSRRTAGVRGPDAGCGMSLLCGLWFSTPEVFWFVLFTCLGDNATIGPGAMVGRSCLPRTSMSLYMN